MKHLVSTVIALAMLVAVVMPATAQPAPPAPPGSDDFLPGQILVQFKPGTPGQVVAGLHRQNGGDVIETIPGIDVQVVAVPRGE